VVRSVDRTRQLRRWWLTGGLTAAAIAAAAGAVASLVPEYVEQAVGLSAAMGLACLVFGRLRMREYGFRGPHPWTHRSHLVLLADEADPAVGHPETPVVWTERYTLWQSLGG